MIFLTAIIATIVSISFLIISPLNGVLVTVMLKPIIDASWRNYYFGLNLLMVIGVAIPLLIFPRIIGSEDNKFFEMPLSKIGTAYLLSYLIGFIIMVYNNSIMDSIEFLSRIVSGFLGFFMFQFYFNERENFRKLLICLLIAGLFPMFMGIYQSATGQFWQIRATAYGLTRNVGLYHDAFSFRSYGFQTLSAILLYWTYFSIRKFSRKILLSIYGIFICFIIYKIYSKAAIAIFIIWLVFWSFTNRKVLWLLIIPLVLLITNYTAKDKILIDTKRVFRKEIMAYKGKIDKKYVLSGRPFLWADLWEKWKRQSIGIKVFGSGKNTGVHNEYLRLLYLNGLVGLMVYILVLGIIGKNLLVNLRNKASPLNIMGVMIFSMWIVDTIGLHPGMYPAYQWFCWGIIGLALRGVTGLDESHEAIAPETHEPVRSKLSHLRQGYTRTATYPKIEVP